jgi:hypothetical protein
LRAGTKPATQRERKDYDKISAEDLRFISIRQKQGQRWEEERRRYGEMERRVSPR